MSDDKQHLDRAAYGAELLQRMQAELDELRREVERLRKERDNLGGKLADRALLLGKAEAKAVQLCEIIARYGRHDKECLGGIRTIDDNPDGSETLSPEHECTCGLAAALKQEQSR